MTDSISFAYIAGYFDGEGSIQIMGQGTLYVSIGNTFLPALQYIQINHGGSISDHTQPSCTKPNYLWQIHANNALSFLMQIVPYLHEKRPQAELAIQVFTTPSWHTGMTRKEARVRLQEMKKIEYAEPIEVEITEELRAYIAGYLDAEGCIMLDHGRVCNVNVGCTHLPIIKLLEELFGGSHFDDTRIGRTKRSYNWQVYSKDAIFLLELVHDHLFEKAPQAKLLIDLFTKPSWETGLSKESVDKELRRLKRVPSYGFGEWRERHSKGLL